MPGFVVLVAGTLIYNEIVILPFWGLDANTKDKLEARAAGEKRDANYMATSPGAAYSSQRNKRLLQKVGDEHYDQVEDSNEYQMNTPVEMSSDQD